MSDTTPPTIDDILGEVRASGYAEGMQYDQETYEETMATAKSQLARLIKEQVIGKDNQAHIITTPAGSDICENCNTYTSYPTDCRCPAHNQLKQHQRANLKALLGNTPEENPAKADTFRFE